AGASVAQPTDRANLRRRPTELYSVAPRRRALAPAPPVLPAVRDATSHTCGPRPRSWIAHRRGLVAVPRPGGTRLAEARTPGRNIMDTLIRVVCFLLSPLWIATADADSVVGGPLHGLTPDQLARFSAGRDAFVVEENVADGLGPVFNGTSCGACHSTPAVGGGSTLVETRFGTTTNGVFDPLANLGGSLIQTDGIGAPGTCTSDAEKVPPAPTTGAGRRTPSPLGLGLAAAVPDAPFLQIASREARLHPSTAGRAHIVTDVTTGALAVGKFGWKSQVPNLLAFS